MSFRVFIGRLNALVVYLAWANIAFLLLLILVGILMATIGINAPKGISGAFIGYNLLFILGGGFSHFLFSFFVKCPHCRKALLIQGFALPKNKGGKIIGGWAYEVSRWFSGSITCIHCGESVNTNTLES